MTGSKVIAPSSPQALERVAAEEHTPPKTRAMIRNALARRRAMSL